MAHKILQEWLDKTGVKNFTDLTSDEKVTYERWNLILSQGEVTVKSITAFCESQKSVIEGLWKDLSNPQMKNDRLIAQHVVYSTMIEAIKAPLSERENLEKHLQNLIQSKP